MENPLVDDYLAARAAWKRAEQHMAELQERLTKQMEADQRKSYRWTADGARHTLTFVQSHTTQIDEAGLRRALRAKVFDRYTKRVLDRKRMEEAMDAGEVDPKVVAPFVTQRPNKAHLTYSARPIEEKE
jgi:hypothetical protein